MSASASVAAPADRTGSIDALKRVRAAEIEWDQRVQAAKQQAATEIAKLRSDADAAVKAAQAEGEQARTLRVQAARVDADREAAQILADGQKATEEAARGEGRQPSDHADEILQAVLAGFLSD